MAISDFLLDDADDAEGGGFTESEEQEESAQEPLQESSQEDEQKPAESGQPDPVRKKLTVLEEQNRLLQSQLEEIRNRPAVQEKKDYNYEPATQDDWAEDPNMAFEKNLKAALAKIQTEQQTIKGEEAKKVNERLAQQHERAWQSVVNSVPEFATDPDLRQSFAAVFHNPANPYLKDPNGPMQAAAYIVQKMGIRPRTAEPAQAETKPAQTPGTARTARVKAGAMHGSGRGGGQKVKSLDPEYARVAKKLGLSEDSMRMAVESEAA